MSSFCSHKAKARLLLASKMAGICRWALFEVRFCGLPLLLEQGHNTAARIFASATSDQFAALGGLNLGFVDLSGFQVPLRH